MKETEDFLPTTTLKNIMPVSLRNNERDPK
jgi:hypothetical protein